MQRYPTEALLELRGGHSNPLFDAFPGLAAAVPWRPIGRYPTPVEELPSPEGPAGTRLFVKRDDLASGLYGGNKVRKLEHLLAEATLARRGSLVTIGGIGSNHALATAIHGATLGFRSDLSLFDQPINPHVRRNLGGFLAAGARLHHAGSTTASLLLARRVFRQRRREGEAPYFIMPGGTSRLGSLGYVTAGLEIAEQVRAGEIPEPDYVFVPLGSTGTAAGLLVGLRLAGLRARIMAVRVADPIPACAPVLRHFARGAADLLHRLDPTVPRLRIARDDFVVLPGYLGQGYGFATDRGEAALRWAEGRLALDPTYTAKTLAASLDFCRGLERPATVLFWNTYNSAPVPGPQSWDALPASIRKLLD